MISQIGYSKAIELLRQASTPMGFVASVQDHDNYQRVWTRDGVVNGLAALMSGDKDLIQTFGNTLKTIFDHQHPSGFIPSNVAADGKISYGGTVGRADNPSWAIIGLCQYTSSTMDDLLSRNYERQVEKCFSVMEAWEFNGKHLLYVPQSGDWADEYIQHGYILFDQLLRIWALRLAAAIYKRIEWREKAERIMTVVRNNFWNNSEPSALYAPNLKHQLALAPSAYWFLGFNPSRIYRYFDLQANSLALLLDVGDESQNKAVIGYIRQLTQHSKAIVPSFYPAIDTADWEMTELESNYAYSFRNKPNEFHNGGLWPVWNGFLAAALKRKNEDLLAKLVVERIHQANGRSSWEMNECFHGKTCENIGVPRCTWSAGGAIIGEQSLAGTAIIAGDIQT